MEFLPCIIELLTSIAQVAVAPATPVVANSASYTISGVAVVAGVDGSAVTVVASIAIQDDDGSGDTDMAQATEAARKRVADATVADDASRAVVQKHS